MKTFRIYWKNGKSTTVAGNDIYDACGIGGKMERISRDDLVNDAKYWQTETGLEPTVIAQYQFMT